MTHPNCDKLVIDALEHYAREEDNKYDFAGTPALKGKSLAHKALSVHRQSTPNGCEVTGDRAKALLALKLIRRFSPNLEQQLFNDVESALTTPPDKVGDEVVDLLKRIEEGWQCPKAMATRILALIKKNGGG